MKASASLNYKVEEVFKIFIKAAKKDFKDFDKENPVGCKVVKKIYSGSRPMDCTVEITDYEENSKYLGEVALVPFNSPISNSNIIFYNTLYDENASCHLAFGASYPSCIKNGENMSNDELLKAKANCSLTHVDFMIGTNDTDIVGVKKDGTKIQVFKDGNWAI